MVNKQRGGIVSFVVVGIVLAGLLAGGLYLSKQQGREARSDTPAPQVTQRDTEREETSGPTARDETRQPGTTDTTQGNRTPTPTTQQPSASTGTRGGAATDRVANTGPSDIPSTGPAETTAAIFALAGLTFAVHRHLASRRVRHHAALRQ